MKRHYTSPALEQELFTFERGFDLSTGIGSWGDGNEYGGDAE